mmetsp:Transcript_32388/g.39809  ORF Transcript_32388/g.39809 Transcript_32388/m.39809 type:complete len:277 (-) Transcript_32388:349-1179(-)|eukprot:CAMPEP_0172497698 /NCGR_PEP_ID=MMETSP1066-20121228/103641_1 /TAXON_ID=671091 /ORGANISM="Coscinodiscus wailesii, Strain CCMP2513" /LENGTH=276 /DNA_ID=CAMNT_0013270613 /DNA_START=90 /DNA_END=920 /DNA_ORIENTATION=+
MTSYLAQQALKSQVGDATAGLNEPLIGNSDAEAGEDGEDGDDKFKKKGFTKMDGIVSVGLLLTVCVTAAAMATAMVLPVAVYVAGGLALGTVPLVAYQRTQIVDTRGLRDFINEIRNTVNELAETNAKITTNIDQLENECGRLKETEGAFQDLAAKQGQNVNKLVELVKESGEITKQLKAAVRFEVSNTIIDVIMKADSSGDFTLDPTEVEMLMLGLQSACEELVTFDEDKLRDLINSNGGDLNSVLKLVAEMYDDDIPEEDKVLQVLETAKNNLS